MKKPLLVLVFLALALVGCGAEPEPVAIGQGEWGRQLVPARPEHVQISSPGFFMQHKVRILPLPEEMAVVVVGRAGATIEPPIKGLADELFGCFVVGFSGPTSSEVTFKGPAYSLSADLIEDPAEGFLEQQTQIWAKIIAENKSCSGGVVIYYLNR